jgi:hypothetical protein
MVVTEKDLEIAKLRLFKIYASALAEINDKINLLKLFIKKCYGCHEELEVDNFKFAKTIGPRKLCIECYKKRQRECSFKKRAKERKNLHDNYIKKLLTRRGNLKAEDIPPQLIELKRAEIKARRFLKKAAQYERT